jgi:ABC-type glycerol-3-phosphate transport system substrate-binding protein
MKARLFMVMLIAVLLVAACNGGEEEQDARSMIRFAAFGWTKTEMFDDLIVAFEEESSDLHVEFVSLEEPLGIDQRGNTPMPDDAAQRLVRSTSGLPST